MTPLGEYVQIASLLAPSLLTAGAIGVAASACGVFVLLRKEGLVALAMPEIVAVGAAVSLRLGLSDAMRLLPPLGAVVVAVLLLAWSKRRGVNAWMLPSVYVAGLCISFLIIANSGQHVAEMQALLTGIDVAVAPQQAWMAVPLLLACGGVVAVLWRRWLLLAQAPATAEVAGVRIGRWEMVFLCLLAVVLLVGTNDLGAVMVVAMLFLPAAIVMPWCRRVPSALIAAAGVSLLLLAGGFVLSIEMTWPFSQSVGGAGFALLVASHALAQIIR